MNRNRKGKMPEITREVYKTVKRYDRQQFQEFCKKLYCYGFEDGRESIPGTDLTKIYEAIADTRGIGEKKLEDIKRNIETQAFSTETFIETSE